VIAVVGAVGCSVGAQYAVKVLVDTLAGGLYVGTNARDAWLGFLLLATLIAVDNLLWRVASWILAIRSSRSKYESRAHALRQEIAKLGWTEGSNIQFDERWTTD
jgi:ATP-binding cassette, subfamily B, bacterial